MTKELESLEFICKILKEKGIDIKWLFKEQYNTIKQRLESIDNANPIEALEKFECIENDIKFAYDDDYVSYDYTDDVEYIKQALIKAQEQEKENNKLKSNLARWLALLETDGIDSKNMVATDIQHILEEIN